jgi:hypothetical protein
MIFECRRMSTDGQSAAAWLAAPRKRGAGKAFREHQKREAISRRDRDGEPMREIARSYNVSHGTILRRTA